ncbi:MAG: hypothetical protein OHK0046_10660 [Anaerolineae bacterium]
MNNSTQLDLQAMRIAAHQREWNTLQDIFKRLIAEVDPLVALQVPAPRLHDFLKTFESYYPEAAWVREMLLTIINYASAPKDLPVHTLNQFPSPGCGNFMMGVFELAWTVQMGIEVFERYSHVTNALSNVLLAELQHLYFSQRPVVYEALREGSPPERTQAQYAFWIDDEVAARDTALWLAVVDDVEKMLQRT